MLGLVTKTICVSAGYLFPAYRCFKLLRGGPEAIGAASSTGEQRDVVKSILKYWVVMAGFMAVEVVVDTFMFWLPLVGLVKISFVAWLVMPGLNGADIVYDNIVEPYLVQNEVKLDGLFRQAEAAAQHSSSTVSKTVYDKWIGFVQRAVNQQSTHEGTSARLASTSSTLGSQRQATEYTGLSSLLQSTVSQKLPQASAAAKYLVGLSGITDGPPTQADTVNKSTLGSLFTSWVTGFSSSTYAQLSENERLRDIRTRKIQLQDLVSQLESSERALLAKSEPAPPLAQSSPVHSPREAHGFEEDLVMVNESGMESSSEAHNDPESPANNQKDSSTVASGAKPPSSTSRRWLW